MRNCWGAKLDGKDAFCSDCLDCSDCLLDVSVLGGKIF